MCACRHRPAQAAIEEQFATLARAVPVGVTPAPEVVGKTQVTVGAHPLGGCADGRRWLPYVALAGAPAAAAAAAAPAAAVSSRRFDARRAADAGGIVLASPVRDDGECKGTCVPSAVVRSARAAATAW